MTTSGQQQKALGYNFFHVRETKYVKSFIIKNDTVTTVLQKQVSAKGGTCYAYIIEVPDAIFANSYIAVTKVKCHSDANYCKETGRSLAVRLMDFEPTKIPLQDYTDWATATLSRPKDSFDRVDLFLIQHLNIKF